jgi:cytochrome c oxidase cbb3-type subunit 3
MSQSDDTNHKIVIREHVFDGIEEYDQKLPNWWLFTFYIMIVYFIFAWVAYYQSPLHIRNDYEKLDNQLSAIEEKKNEELESMMATLNDDSLREMSLDATHVAAGKAIFDTKCVACHGADLSATMSGLKLPGVALNDSEWLYGGEPLKIMGTITNGSPDITKGMIAWKSQLGPAETAQVVAYILSYHK